MPRIKLPLTCPLSCAGESVNNVGKSVTGQGELVIVWSFSGLGRFQQSVVLIGMQRAHDMAALGSIVIGKASKRLIRNA